MSGPRIIRFGLDESEEEEDEEEESEEDESEEDQDDDEESEENFDEFEEEVNPVIIEVEDGSEETFDEEVNPPPPPPSPQIPSSDMVLDSEEIATTTTSYKAQAEEEEEEGGRWNREDVEGLFCPICMEPWTSSGDHQPSCLSCGHLFGLSCITKWLEQGRSSRKCPQCNKKCTLKDVRRIYGSRVVVVDEESQKRIRFLEAKCVSLEKKDGEWRKKEAEWQKKVLGWQKKEAALLEKLEKLSERTSTLERTVGDLESKALSRIAGGDGFEGYAGKGYKTRLDFSPPSSYNFELQQDLQLDGARLFDVDDTGQILIAVRRPAQPGRSYALTKMSLVCPLEHDNVLLPSNINLVRDLHLSQSGKLALLATAKQLAILSMETNNIVLNYDLPAPAWSCSWDANSSNHIYAGLQNGMLLVFDLRQTEIPLESRSGVNCRPVHTVYSLSGDSLVDSGNKKILTASSVGLYQWNIGSTHDQPSLMTEAANQGACVSLACCPGGDNVVATFRSKVVNPDNSCLSQVSQTPSSIKEHHVPASQVLLKRVNSNYQVVGSTCTHVPNVRLPKSTILGMGDGTSLFACGDEATINLALKELPSLLNAYSLQSNYPIRDVKYTASVKPSLLCCLSEDRVQFFSQKQL